MIKKIVALLLLCLPLLASQGQIANTNHIDIWYETFGDKKNPTVLLIMGGCCQGVLWPKAFCEQLAEEGFFVIRYDHRDAGLSSCFDFEKQPYEILDMAQDTAALLEALHVEKAHLFGVSLGALLAETLAAYFPEKVHSILLLGSTCDIRPMNLAYAGQSAEANALPPPTSSYLNWMIEFMKLSPQTFEEKLANRMEGWNRLNGQKMPLDSVVNREIHEEFLMRLRYPQGIINHIIMLRSEQSEKFVRLVPSKIAIPTVILHGTEDPIFPPAHGERLKQAIKNAEYFLVDGMGHVPSNHFYNFYIEILKRQALAASCTAKRTPSS